MTQSTKYEQITLLTAAVATNSPPSGASAGVDVSGVFGSFTAIDWAVLQVRSTAGSATMTVAIRLWGYNALSAAWFPLGVGADATKGAINAGTTLGETAADTIRHTEPVYYVSAFDRVYAEITAIGGTSTAITVELIVPRQVA